VSEHPPPNLPFLDWLARGPVVFAGAMTTMLRAASWPAARPAELATVEAPDRVRSIHDAYRQAGAEVLTANTLTLWCPSARLRRARKRPGMFSGRFPVP
jgi:methionine synthase I (cobalamin-dependent)